MPDLSGRVCLVTGASRGIGRGIALQLVRNGGTCYITGRSSATLNKVVEEAIERGLSGEMIACECDHSNPDNVKMLFERIANEQNNRLDLLVNNAYAAVDYILDKSKTLFWDLDPVESWETVNNVGLRNHFICTVYAARLMVSKRFGLIVNIGSIGGITYMTTPTYGIGKEATDRMARDCAVELKKSNVVCLSYWPGAVQTEAMLDLVEKATEQNRPDAAQTKWIVENAESPEFSGKCISHMLVDPNIMKKSGKMHLSCDIANEYNVNDIDGFNPQSLKSFKFLAVGANQIWLAKYFPSWLKLPTWLFKLLLGAAPIETIPKNPSSYS